MDVGLEHARSALLRNQGADSLAALDRIWDRARRTEEGWYLRSSALSLLGLPGESDRIAEAGLSATPGSLALRFAQSVARLAAGDVPAAKASLQHALLQAPQEPLLLVQQAILDARQGDRAGAERLLERAAAHVPNHPALDYGRAAVRGALADAVRRASRATPSSSVALSESPIELPTAVPPSPSRAAQPQERIDDEHASEMLYHEAELSGLSAHDVIDAAFTKIGAELVSAAGANLAGTTRGLLRAFSAGGTLASACSPEQAHAARTLLSTLIGVLTSEPVDGPSPIRTMLQQLVAGLRDARAADAERLLRKAPGIMREPAVRLLSLVVAGAIAELERTHRAFARGVMHTPASSQSHVSGRAESGAIVPIRLGLALLSETERLRVDPWDAVPDATSVRSDIVERNSGAWRMQDAEGGARLSAGVVGGGRASWHPTPAERRRLAADDMRVGMGARSIALACVGLAAAALSTGFIAVAIGLGVGASWLALRRSGRDAAAEAQGLRGGTRDPRHEDGVADPRAFRTEDGER